MKIIGLIIIWLALLTGVVYSQDTPTNKPTCNTLEECRALVEKKVSETSQEKNLKDYETLEKFLGTYKVQFGAASWTNKLYFIKNYFDSEFLADIYVHSLAHQNFSYACSLHHPETGKVKIYFRQDFLLAEDPPEEYVLAITAHELGHDKFDGRRITILEREIIVAPDLADQIKLDIEHQADVRGLVLLVKAKRKPELLQKTLLYLQSLPLTKGNQNTKRVQLLEVFIKANREALAKP